MPKSCLKYIAAFLVLILFFAFFTHFAFAAACGNGSCQTSQGETCLTCPADCGVCPTPTSVPTSTPTTAPEQPTNTPTPTTEPTATPTPTTSSSSPPTSTPTPTPTPTPSIYYPFVVLSPYGLNPTNQASLTFLGKANIGQGTISAVEFSIDSSSYWQQASPIDGSFNSNTETFMFTTQSLSEGQHAILVRAKSNVNVYTQENLYETDNVIVVTTKPTIILEPIPQVPTKNQTPTIRGTVTVSDLTTISKVEVSNNDRKTWFTADVKDNSFSLTFKKLEDANYSIVVRATDAVGNVEESATQRLIIDTIPPTLGGAMIMFGNQTVTPNPDGTIQAVTGIPINMILSLKGGVTQANISTNSESFELKPIQGTNLWTAILLFKIVGENPLVLSAQDGAFNKIEKKLQTISVETPGKAYNSSTLAPLENVKVSVFYFDFISNTWDIWDAEGFGQKNPFLTKSDGAYSFMVPPGRYYIQVNLPGFDVLQSEILDFSKTSLIRFYLPLVLKPHVTIVLPFIGSITFSFSSFFPTKTLSVLQEDKNFTVHAPVAQPTQALSFSLPDKNNNFVTLSSFAGKKVLLTFFSTWTPHSVGQASILSKISQSIFSNQSIQGIIVQESRTTADIFMRRGQYQFNYLVDEIGTTANSYNVTVLPQHFFIDSKGIIRETISGVLDENTILEKLNQLP